ncbi:MAG: PH domain-containing protein [Nanobdellota archaeon]
MERLHPGVKWKFRFESYFGMIVLYIFFIISLISNSVIQNTSNILLISLGFALIYIIVAEIFIHLSYVNWGYEFTQDSLKIEKGIIIKKYKSIPYERIQNVDITRGVIARIIGFSTIDIQTAGYSSYNIHNGRMLSEGHLPAISKEGAERIREFLVSKIAGRKQGL